MVSSLYERLNSTFAAALKDGGLTSRVGDDWASTQWMAPKFGDVYVHETVISHVRRLLDMDFMCASLTESFARFEAADEEGGGPHELKSLLRRMVEGLLGHSSKGSLSGCHQ